MKEKKVKKVIQFINDEHVNPKIASATGCASQYEDRCFTYDETHCTYYAVDICDKDYASCSYWAIDSCETSKDINVPCSGRNEEDYTY